MCPSEAVNLRLRSSSEANAYQSPQEQEPAVHWSKGTEQAKIHDPDHTNHQTLFTKETHEYTESQPMCKNHSIKQEANADKTLLPYLSDIIPQTGELIPIPKNTT